MQNLVFETLNCVDRSFVSFVEDDPAVAWQQWVYNNYQPDFAFQKAANVIFSYQQFEMVRQIDFNMAIRFSIEFK